MTFRQLSNDRFSPNLATPREFRSLEMYLRRILKIFSLGTFNPKTSKLKGVKQVPYSVRPAYSPRNAVQREKDRGRGREIYCSMHVVVHGQGVSHLMLVFCTRHAVRAIGCQISLFLSIFPYKTPKAGYTLATKLNSTRSTLLKVDKIDRVDLARIHTSNKVDRIGKVERIGNKKYVLSNSEFVQCNFFVFDHVTFIQFKICCCVQNFIKIQLFFTEIWRYNDFQNGGRTPSWILEIFFFDHVTFI